MEDKKISFFKRIKIAIFNVEKYQNLISEDVKVAVKYFVKLILLFVAIVCFAIAYKFGTIAQDAIQVLKNEMPEFTFADNLLTTDSTEPKVIEKSDKNTNYVIIIDTNADTEKIDEYNKKIDSYDFGVILLNNRLIYSTRAIEGIQSINYDTLASRYNIENFTKQDLVNKIDAINPASAYIALYLTLLLYLFVSYLISTLLESFLLFVLGYFTAKIVLINLKSSQVYTIALYSLTLPILLNAIYIPVNLLTGFEIKYFQVMYTAISYIYLIAAILLIRSDLVKQQVEIGKINEVQKQVRDELEQQDDKKDENDDENNGQDENKKEKKENKKDGDIGLNNDQTPEGNA